MNEYEKIWNVGIIVRRDGVYMLLLQILENETVAMLSFYYLENASVIYLLILFVLNLLDATCQ